MGLLDWLGRLVGGAFTPSPRQRSMPATVIRTSATVPAAPSTPRPNPGPPGSSARINDLQLSRFAPLSREELDRLSRRKDLRGMMRWWWNDGIPPAEEPGTQLVDRSMVADGMITPERLARMHEVGDLYREYRPDFLAAHAKATQEVAVADEERQSRKAEKQAASKARKEAHAKAVAERRAHDVIFLGCGVSKGLSDRRTDVEKLQKAGLPLLTSPGDVATFLGITIPRLRWLAFHSDASEVSHYVFFTIPKKTGGVRRLSAPHRDLALCQQAIFDRILANATLHDAAHGFVKGRSTLSNAQPHVGAHVVVNLDLKDFFPSITFPRVRGIFAGMGFSPAAASILALLCTESPREEVGLAGKRLFVAAGPRALPQGACTSPGLANLAARHLDARLAGLAKAWGWSYTRYADDLTFSAQEAGKDIGRLLTAVRHVVDDEGFTVNEGKTRVLRRNQAQEVTGLIVNQRAKAPRTLIRRIRAILHHATKEGLEAQNREGHPHFESWLRGMIAYIAMTDKTTAARFRSQLDQFAKPGDR